MAVGKDTPVPQNDPESAETAAARRLTDALAPSAIDALLADAKAAGTPIDGVDGLLNQMTKAVLERALQTEMTHHLGYGRDDPAGAGTGNSRNGASMKTVSTTNGPVTISVPRDRNGEFEPQIVPKRVRRVGQIDPVPSPGREYRSHLEPGAGRRTVCPTCCAACGIPSTWQRPTTRRPGGSPRCSRRPRLPGSASGRRVATREVVGMPLPDPPTVWDCCTRAGGIPETAARRSTFNAGRVDKANLPPIHHLQAGHVPL